MTARSVALLLLAPAALIPAPVRAQTGSELRLSLRHDPKTFDPALVEEDAGETIRYLTGGVLVRINRITGKPEAGLAESWKVSPDGRTLQVRLRTGLRFSDGTPLTSEDVAFTFRRLLDPALHAPTGDAFRSSAGVVATAIQSPTAITVVFPATVASLERLLDQVAIQSARSPLKERAVAGPFVVKEYKAGTFVLLERNPNFWRRDAQGRRLPYLDAVRFSIQSNREMESVRLRRGELHMADRLDPEIFDRLKSERNLVAVDAGATTDLEMLWFNQAEQAPLAESKKAWFRSREFRQGISSAISRSDIARLAYRNYAEPASGPLPAASLWFNRKLRPPPYDPEQARRWFERAGFRLAGGQWWDARGNAVVFSIVTNASSKVHGQIAALIQQDLQKAGVKVNLASLEFRSLIERIGETSDYEACLLGLVNVDDDPNGQMNLWLSSSANHPWHPSQKSPATGWEAEIDRLMTAQASTADQRQRKKLFDRVQELVQEQAPVIFLVNPHALAAYSRDLRDLVPSPARPHLFWNIERLRLGNIEGASHARAALAN
ncbi:MAG: ABC transporter substrate-binding protein [Acidobacteriia bacterium]|nr:ABC transporter substrate-binding protein [Terriglobia bacterium]